MRVSGTRSSRWYGSRLAATLFPPAALLGAISILFATSVTWAQPAQMGQWSGPITWPIVASHAALLADGQVLVWSDLAGTTPRIWDPVSSTLTTPASINTTVIGAGQVQLADGDVLVFGGRDAGGAGLVDAHRYDVAGTWTALPSLNQARGEPTGVLQSDGRALALSGEIRPGQPADRPEIAVLGTPWTQLFGAAFGLPMRPWAFLLANGQILVAGPDRRTRRLDLVQQSWSAVGSMNFGGREGGTAVLMPAAPDRVLVLGGHEPATSSCEILDLPATNDWKYTGSMLRPRRHFNATLLADGSVLATGGTLTGDALDQAVYAPERYIPATGTWSLLASMNVPRRRGSVALLLPDASVLCAGGGDGTPGSETHSDAEIFWPPYLFLGTRPTIGAAPSTIAYSDSFDVDTPQAASIVALWLLRAGAVSRGFDSEQRALSLPFTVTTGRLTATAPADSDLAPPGTWMLFLVSNAGAPSEAKILQLNRGATPQVPPVITSTPPNTAKIDAPYNYAPAASGSPPMTWSLPVKPSWLGVSPSTGFVAGAPTASGNFDVTLRATNAAGSTDQSWVLQVGDVAPMPRIVVPIGAMWKYFKGTSFPGSTWPTPEFVDGAWLSGPSGFGFGDNDDATVLSDMQGLYTTVFTRRTFDLYRISAVTQIALLYEFDDGLAVYLNGTRIWARNAPTTITNTSVATGSHEASTTTLSRQNFTDGPTLALLRTGTNVLAAVGLNQTISSNDVTLKVSLEVSGGSDVPVDAPAADAPASVRVHPNPFAARTQVSFSTSLPGDARLEIFDVAGHRVRSIAGRQLPAGAHVLVWDGLDGSGRRAAPGVYFYRLSAPGLERRGKLTRAR